MELIDSPGLSRLALTELVKKFQDEYTMVVEVIEKEACPHSQNA